MEFNKIRDLDGLTDWYMFNLKAMNNISQVLNDLNLSFGQFIILRALDEDSSLSTSELSREFHQSTPAMFRKINNLRKRGYINKHHDNYEDHRRVNLVITDEGRSALLAAHIKLDQVLLAAKE